MLPRIPSACMDVPRKMSVVGTAFWMAPEVLRGEEYTRQVDVFSFGIVVCEIVARITANPDDLPRTGVRTNLENCKYRHVQGLLRGKVPKGTRQRIFPNGMLLLNSFFSSKKKK